METSTIAFIVLFAFICGLKSFNRLERWLENKKFKKLLPRRRKLPRIDTIRRSLSSFDIDSLNGMHEHIVKTAFRNKVFRKGTIDGLKVAAIDGVEVFESTKKSCERCLTRVDKQGVTHYYHKAVVCATVGSDPHIVLGYEMLEPKKIVVIRMRENLVGVKGLLGNYTSNFIILRM